MNIKYKLFASFFNFYSFFFSFFKNSTYNSNNSNINTNSNTNSINSTNFNNSNSNNSFNNNTNSNNINSNNTINTNSNNNNNFNNVFFIIDQKNSINGNVKFIKKELDKKGDFNYNYLSKDEYSFNSFDPIAKKIAKLFKLIDFFLVKTYKLSKSKYIFLNDNFFPIAFMNFKKGTKIIQLWHAPGVFKKFGLSIVEDGNIRELTKSSNSKVDYIITTSKNISKFYENAFGVSNDKVIVTGIPRTDYYFDKDINNQENIAKIREKFENSYPQIKGKKIILYAPTFREKKELNNEIANHFDMELFNDKLGNSYSLLFRAHPKITTQKMKNSIDVTNYPDEKELLLIADILITDYSSIMVEYALLLKPIIFYPFDLDYYITNERGFYYDYSEVPGLIAKNTEDIIDFIKNNNWDIDKIKNFIDKQYDYLDNKSSKRIVDFIFKNNS